MGVVEVRGAANMGEAPRHGIQAEAWIANVGRLGSLLYKAKNGKGRLVVECGLFANSPAVTSARG